MKIEFTQEKRGEIERIQHEFRNRLSQNEILRLTSQAINRVLSRSISRITKNIKDEYNITQKYLARTAKVSPWSNRGKLWGAISINENRLPVIAFKPKQSKSSISVAFHKGQTKYIRNAFIATVPAGKKGEETSEHTGVFSRGKYIKRKGFYYYTKAERRKGGIGRTKNDKVRITQRMGPSVFSMSVNKKIAQDVQQFMGNEVTARVRGILTARVAKIAAQNR
ncbi:phage tail protein [uncultured Rikenella sp.]|uniref:phage tail protein n=1 Tax=uncultured Rikenella sp. TaxID=368003 RepID=UPI0025F18475|nr:phage tail protein [uncultured Rikenella sp.]